MSIEITERKEQPLLSRLELKGTVSFEARTVSNDEFRKALAASLKADEGLIVVRRIITKYGERSASFFAYCYKDKPSMERVEPKKKGKKAAPEAAGQEGA